MVYSMYTYLYRILLSIYNIHRHPPYLGKHIKSLLILHLPVIIIIIRTIYRNQKSCQSLVMKS